MARRLDALLAMAETGVDGTYMCPHHPEITGPCEGRKPGTRHYRSAAERFGLDLTQCWWVGDRVTDVEPAASLGGRGILLGQGVDLAGAAKRILGEESRA